MTEAGFVHQFIPGTSDGPCSSFTERVATRSNSSRSDANSIRAAAILSPRGNVLENGNARFFRRLAEGVFDLEDLKAQTDALAAFVRAAAGHYQFDLEKLVAVGYSNGANIAASILLRRPGLLSAAILLRAMVPLIPEELPDLRGVDVWIAGGKRTCSFRVPAPSNWRKC